MRSTATLGRGQKIVAKRKEKKRVYGLRLKRSGREKRNRGLAKTRGLGSGRDEVLTSVPNTSLQQSAGRGGGGGGGGGGGQTR